MFPFLKLSDETITLRPYEFGDEDELHKAVQESLPELKPWMSWASEAYSRDVARNFIAVTRAQWSSGVMYAFSINDAKTGEFLGGCGLSHIHPVYHFCNLGYWVRTPRHGQGIAVRATKLIAKFAFEKVNLIRTEIVMAVENSPSKRVAEKAGAHYEGISLNRMVVGKDIYDAHMFSLVPADFGLVAEL